MYKQLYEKRIQKGPQTSYWDTTSLTCLPRVTNGAGCTQDCDCFYQTNMTCVSGKCACSYTNQYWSSALSKCLIYRGYGDSCDSDASPVFLCASGLTCQLTPSCMCPQTVGNSSCDCLITQYWDGSSKCFGYIYEKKYLEYSFN